VLIREQEKQTECKRQNITEHFKVSATNSDQICTFLILLFINFKLNYWSSYIIFKRKFFPMLYQAGVEKIGEHASTARRKC
jgi:hypothetical protein